MSLDEGHLETVRAHRELHLKHTSFLLAAAGAAIGLVVNQTREASIAWAHAPLGAAVVCWGLSFWAGCRRVDHVSSMLIGNAALFEVRGEARARIHASMNAINGKAVGLWHAQFRLLVAGAILYVVWHVLEMYQRAASAPISL